MRQKIEMKLIENEKARKKTFLQRKKSLEKKAKELSILCDVKTLLIIYELGKQTPEIWTGNDGEAEEIIDSFKQRRARGGTKKARANSFASEKKGFLEKFAMLDLKNLINHLPENDLRMLCSELDAKIAAVSNEIKPKQAVTEEEPRSSNMLSDSQETGLLNKEKGKEVVTYQEPVHTQEDQSFQMLPYNPTFMESPMMMMNDFGNPEFDVSSTSTNFPYNSIPVHYVPPSWMQQAYMNSDSSVGYYEPTTYHIPPGIYYQLMPFPGFPLR